MTSPTTKRKLKKGIMMERVVLLLFLTLLIISAIEYFAVGNHSVKYFFAHFGALNIIGLLGCGVGAIAKKKSYSYWKAFFTAVILPIISGVAVVLFIPSVTCGGSFCLAVALLLVIVYSLLQRRKIKIEM